MSDQGYGQPAFEGQPQYGQQPGQPQWGDQSGGGQQPPPYGQQPPYGADPAYGQQPYGPQFPGTPPYGTPYGGDTPPPGTPTGGTGGSGKWMWGAIAAAVIVALGIGGYFLFAGGDDNGGSGGSSPTAAVKGVIDAAKQGDIASAKANICAADQSLITGQASSIVTTILSTAQIGQEHINSDGNSGTVDVTVSFAGQSTPFPVPVTKENGAWKVCPDPSSLGSLGGISISGVPSGGAPTLVPTFPSEVPSGIPTVPSISVPSISGLPSGIPGNLSNLCGFATDAETAALTYVGFAEIGEIDSAQGCIYQGSVPQSVTESLKVTNSTGYYAPSGNSGHTYQFASVDGAHHLAVTVEKESDGLFYVTKVETS